MEQGQQLEAQQQKLDRGREDAAGEGRVVPDAEGSDQGAVLGRRGAGADRRGRDRDRRGDGRRRPRDPAREGQDRADAGARRRRSRSSPRPARSRTSPRPATTSTASSPRSRPAARSTTTSRGSRPSSAPARSRRRSETGEEKKERGDVIVRLMGEGQYEVDDGAPGAAERDRRRGRRGARGRRPGRDARGAAAPGRGGARARARRLDDTDLSTSDAVVPPEDLTLDEAHELLEGEGLIPDLPVAGGSVDREHLAAQAGRPREARAARRRATICQTERQLSGSSGAVKLHGDGDALAGLGPRDRDECRRSATRCSLASSCSARPSQMQKPVFSSSQVCSKRRADLDEACRRAATARRARVVEREDVLAQRALEVVAVAPEADQLAARVALHLVEQLAHGAARRRSRRRGGRARRTARRR